MSEQPQPQPTSKPGWKTSEAWVTVLVCAFPLIQAVLGLDLLPAETSVKVSAVVASVYVVVRTILKALGKA